MIYDVFIVERTGFAKTLQTESTKDLAQLRKEAHESAARCLPFNQYDPKFTHLVYYYELPANAKGHVQVKVLHIPDLVDDATLDRFVDDWHPDYVGAIHRR